MTSNHITVASPPSLRSMVLSRSDLSRDILGCHKRGRTIAGIEKTEARDPTVRSSKELCGPDSHSAEPEEPCPKQAHLSLFFFFFFLIAILKVQAKNVHRRDRPLTLPFYCHYFSVNLAWDCGSWWQVASSSHLSCVAVGPEKALTGRTHSLRSLSSWGPSPLLSPEAALQSSPTQYPRPL